MDEEKYTLSNLIDLTGLIKSPIIKSPRLKYTVFDASRNYLILAATSGSLYIFNRNPFSFFKIIPSILGQITNIAISHDENIVAFSNNSSVAFIDLRLVTKLQKIQLPNRACISCFFWNYDNKQLYVGDKSGNVSIINLSYFIGRNILNLSIHPILLLDNPIVQISGFNDYLLVSTTTKCVLCNNERETFKQIGNRPRDGEFGACFTVNYEKMEQQQKQMMINTIDDYELMLNTHVKIYCARPGLRLWECDLNGNVLNTLQFKSIVNTHPSVNLQQIDVKRSQPNIVDKNVQFRAIYTLSHMFLVIFNSSGFFILDPLRSKVLFWTNEFNKNITSAKLIDNCIFLYLADGKMFQINFYKVEQYVYHLCETEQYLECCDLLKSDTQYFLKLIKSKISGDEPAKLRNLLKLRDFLIKNGLNDVLDKLSQVFEEISNQKYHNVLILNKAMFSGKGPLPDIVEDDVQMVKEEETPEEPQIQIPFVSKKLENQETMTQEEIDRVVRKLYMISQSFASNSSIRYAQIFDCYNSSSIIKILKQFEQVLIEEFSNNPTEAHEKIIKIYFDYLNPELIYELDEPTLNFIKDGLICLNDGLLKTQDCQKCGFPLNVWQLGCGKYEAVATRLQTFYWSRQERDKCFELAQKIPSTLKIVGKFLIEERNYQKMIRYIINIGDQELLRAALDQFNDIELFKELLDDFDLLITEKQLKCLNCFETCDAHEFQLNNFYTWNNLFMEIGKCLHSDELLNLLLIYSDRVGNLSREFYLKLLLQAVDN